MDVFDVGMSRKCKMAVRGKREEVELMPGDIS